MKRGQPLRRGKPLKTVKPIERTTGLSRTGSLERRARLSPVSDRRKAENRERRAMVAKLWPDERPLCVVYTLSQGNPGLIPDKVLSRCERWADDVHEPLTRARGGSITDPGNAVPPCRPCHDVLTFRPEVGTRLGLRAWSAGPQLGRDEGRRGRMIPVTDAAAALALKRDGRSCVCCGAPIAGRPFGVIRRQCAGGDRLSNLVTLLGSGSDCLDLEDHLARVWSGIDSSDKAFGYSVRAGADPALVPVMLFRGPGRMVTAWPTDDGEWSLAEPKGAAALWPRPGTGRPRRGSRPWTNG